MQCKLIVAHEPPNHYDEIIYEVLCEDIGLIMCGLEKSILGELVQIISILCVENFKFTPTSIVCLSDNSALSSWTNLPDGTHTIEII